MTGDIHKAGHSRLGEPMDSIAGRGKAAKIAPSSVHPLARPGMIPCVMIHRWEESPTVKTWAALSYWPAPKKV